MSFVRNFALVVFTISFLTFVALFGRLPALRKTPIGWLQRVLCLHLPAGLKKIDASITGGSINHRSQKIGQYLFYEKNPVVLIIFLILLSGSICMFLWQALEKLPHDLLLPLPILLPLPFLFTYLCVSYKAHYITSENHATRLHDYPYDYILYQPNVVCSTCKFAKPARSKHCSLCGFCVAKCDHHCPWVNNCLGRGNYRYFMALLLSLSVLQTYGAYLSWYLLRPSLHFNPTDSFFSTARASDIFRALGVAIKIGGLSIAGVGLLAASTASLPFALFLYHCYLIWAGMTTNESQKWADWRDDIGLDCVFKANVDALMARNEGRIKGSSPDDLPSAFTMTKEDTVYSKNWPYTSEETLVRTMDQNPPRGQEQLWSRVRSLNEVENIYDLGTWQNLTHTFKGI